MKNFKINKNLIGHGSPVYFIADIAANHDGKLERAKKLIELAKENGADAVKFQTWRTELLMTKKAKLAKYQKNDDPELKSQFDMAKKLELSYRQFVQLKNYCDKKKIIFLST